jgi:transcriptional regulator with XRE-family HTH domain
MGVENKFNKAKSFESASEDRLENEKRYFANFLLAARSILKKTDSETASELGVSKSAIRSWEGKKDSLTLPKPSQLSSVAYVYGLDLSELTRRFQISDRASDKQKGSRILITRGNPKIKK